MPRVVLIEEGHEVQQQVEGAVDGLLSGCALRAIPAQGAERRRGTGVKS